MELEEATSRLRALLDEAIASVRADGVLLSGGLDTSIIALLARRHIPKLKAFTVTLEGVYDDVKYAEMVADVLGLDHQVYRFNEGEVQDAAVEAEGILKNRDYEADVPEHIKESIVQGRADVVGPSTLGPVYLAMRFASRFVESVYCGDGADELFVGYDSMVGFIDHIVSTGSPAFARDMERDVSSRVFQAFDLRYPYMLASALGLRLNPPYLTRKVAQFAGDVPVELKVRRVGEVAWGKWLLRKAFEDYLPPEVVWRRKTPIDVGTGTIRAIRPR